MTMGSQKGRGVARDGHWSLTYASKFSLFAVRSVTQSHLGNLLDLFEPRFPYWEVRWVQLRMR